MTIVVNGMIIKDEILDYFKQATNVYPKTLKGIFCLYSLETLSILYQEILCS